MSILDRDSLQASTLADLHAIASELSIDSFRRLRKAELIDAILERQGGAVPAREERPLPDSQEEHLPDAEEPAEAVKEDVRARDEGDAPEPSRRRRGRRSGRGRAAGEESTEPAGGEAAAPGGEAAPGEEAAAPGEAEGDQVVEGVVEVLAGGSGFVRVSPPEPSDEDVYISAAQVRRCELVSGDRVSGPRRPPRRSERFASLVRVETVNGRPAGEVADGTRFEDRTAMFPSESLLADSSDAAIRAITAVAPLGRGSRVTIVGPAQSGKTEALRHLAAGLAAESGLEVWLVLAGVRPEEIPEWQSGPVAPASAVGLSGSPDAQSQAVEAVVEQGRRVAARGSHAAVLIDSLDHLHEHVARKTLASARRIAEGGSLTVIATASRPVGGETTVIGLDVAQAAGGNHPAVSPALSWTMHAEQLVGDKQAEKLAKARARALHG